MNVILMNKNTEVLKAEMDDNTFKDIIEIYNIEYAPMQVYNAYNDKSKNVSKALNEWFKGRGIPSWRKDLRSLLENIGVSYPEELLLKSFGLSLSDQYWIKEENSDVLWENINFFDNDFEYLGYLEVTYSSNIEHRVSLASPNNTTDGMLSKAWLIDEGKRKLMKGTYALANQEPINEYIASLICDRLNIDHVSYKITTYNNKLVSVCDNALNSNEEIISAYDIFTSKKQSNNDSDYTHYINLLRDMGITDPEKELSNMYLIDYIMMNYDRHMKNYGVIRNVETLKIEKTMPIFDNGQGLCCDKTLMELDFTNGKYKLFNNINARFSDLIKYIDLSLYDLDKLNDIPNILNNTLHEYIMYTDMSEDRIDKVVKGINYRIEYLKDLKESNE